LSHWGWRRPFSTPFLLRLLFLTPAIPAELQSNCREAAALACVCRAATAAAPLAIDKWRSAVRVGPSGHVLEPASGAFDVTVAPGEDVQAAVDRCPPGGSVLLLPGTHSGSLELAATKEVHIFGRGRAMLRAEAGQLVASEAVEATLDGLVVRRDPGEYGGTSYGVLITDGALRVQACDITCAVGPCVYIEGGDPVLASCR